MIQITDRIREAIEAQGLTVARLAEVTAIPRVTLIRRLANPSSFTLHEIARVAEALGTTPTALASEDAA